MKITCQKNGSVNETDRIELARLLVKFGYTVCLNRERPPSKPKGAWIHSIEYWESDKRVEQ